VVSGERPLDRRLTDRQPVQRGVKLVLINDAEAELLAEAGAGGLWRQRAGAGELGTGLEQAADDKRQDQIATAVALRAEQTIEADLARRPEGGKVMACWSCGMTMPPLSSTLKPATRSAGQSERLSRVRFLTLPPSR
jgi:hypothetical protein